MIDNLSMLVDFYEFTMVNGFFENGMENTIGYYDMFFRSVPDQGGFAIMAGLESLIDYLKNLHFTEEDIAFFESKKIFGTKMLDYLRHFKFECDVWAVKEGMPIFPGEPLIVVRGPIVQAQLLETMLLLTINHQSLIATKTNRIVRAAAGRPVMEFGSRRAQGHSAATLGARASFIGGCSSTACTLAGEQYQIPVTGTMAHSWVQLFPTELDAFRAYASKYPDDCVLLVDTYNVLKSGVPNAIRTFREVLDPLGKRPKGIRLDSGDITYLSKKCRTMLDAAGYEDCSIVASNSLDEHIIRDTLNQGALIDSFGVGERLITSQSTPILGGVYKLVAVEDEAGTLIPKIKLSENVTKITTPCFKQLYRFYSNDTGKAVGDVITLHDEVIDDSQPYELFDPEHTWKRKTVTDFTSRKLLVKIFDKGNCVYESPSLIELQKYCKKQVETIWDEVKRFENPHKYYVDLSQSLWDIKNELLQKYSR